MTPAEFVASMMELHGANVQCVQVLAIVDGIAVVETLNIADGVTSTTTIAANVAADLIVEMDDAFRDGGVHTTLEVD